MSRWRHPVDLTGGRRAPMAGQAPTGLAARPGTRATERLTVRLRAAAGRTAAAVGLAVAGVVLLAGCSQEVVGVGVPRTSTDLAAPAPATSVPVTTPPAPPVPTDDEEEIVLVDADVFTRAPSEGVWFATPTRNINCLMSEDWVRCDTRDNTWTLPPRPADCEFDFGTSLGLDGTGRGELTCVSDAVADDDPAVLGYGTSVEYNGMTCTSRRTGLRCSNAATGHGFTVSRAAYTLF